MTVSPISDAEAHVMDVLWRQRSAGPLSADEIAQALSPQREWKPSTVKTLLSRLLAKGAITAQADGRRYLYSPVLQREDWVRQESRGLLDRCFGGQLAPLVSHFAAQRKLKRADINALKRLLDEHGRA